MSSNSRVGGPDVTVPGKAGETLDGLRKGAHSAATKEVSFAAGGSPQAEQGERPTDAQIGVADGEPDGGNEIERDTIVEHFYPAKYISRTKEDDRIALKRLLAQPQADGAPPVLGRVDLEARDVAWFKNKLAEVEEYNFDRWLANNYDLRRPDHVKEIKRLHPQYYDRIRKRNRTWFELAKRMFEINMEGIKGQKDLALIYAIRKGEIRLPPPWFWMPEGVMNRADSDQKASLGPIFNPSDPRRPHLHARPARDRIGERPMGGSRSHGALALGRYEMHSEDKVGRTVAHDAGAFAGLRSVVGTEAPPTDRPGGFRNAGGGALFNTAAHSGGAVQHLFGDARKNDSRGFGVQQWGLWGGTALPQI